MQFVNMFKKPLNMKRGSIIVLRKNEMEKRNSNRNEKYNN